MLTQGKDELLKQMYEERRGEKRKRASNQGGKNERWGGAASTCETFSSASIF